MGTWHVAYCKGGILEELTGRKDFKGSLKTPNTVNVNILVNGSKVNLINGRPLRGIKPDVSNQLQKYESLKSSGVLKDPMTPY